MQSDSSPWPRSSLVLPSRRRVGGLRLATVPTAACPEVGGRRYARGGCSSSGRARGRGPFGWDRRYGQAGQVARGHAHCACAHIGRRQDHRFARSPTRPSTRTRSAAARTAVFGDVGASIIQRAAEPVGARPGTGQTAWVVIRFSLYSTLYIATRTPYSSSSSSSSTSSSLPPVRPYSSSSSSSSPSSTGPTPAA